MKSLLIKVAVTLTALAGLGYLIQSIVVDDPVIALWKVYLFLSLATLATIAALRWLQLYMPDKLGLGFLVLMTVKLGAILLLFPELTSDEPPLSKGQLLEFLIPYFLFLFVEIGLVLKWLNDN